MPEPTPPPQPAATVPDHELIRPIGRGSYGEVWLARNVLGEFRAVKIVRRGSFDRDRPVERELEGIQKFEPISRTHENQVHILHVGRFTDGFYYVMELADDGSESRLQAVPRDQSAPGPDPSEAGTPSTNRLTAERQTYSPKTLRSEIQRRGRLPIEECLDIALKLTDALAHLHGHGLVHRDLKPSNIIFVRGQPKLADIGLVASSDSSMSCVGTEGFLPPEGPGKPQADLYALGKVLYEISTGRDRHDFPELPTMLRDDPQRRALEEFNEVILKACDPDVRERYATARAMHADVELLRAGKSLQRARRSVRRWASARKVLAAAAIAAVLLALPVTWWTKPRPIGQRLPVSLHVDGAEYWRAPFTARQFDFSPDGGRIVFAGTNGISIWERTTRLTRRLELRDMGEWKIAGTRGALTMPRWAPDSRQFAFQAIRMVSGTPAEPVVAYAIMLANPNTGGTKQIGSEVPEAERASDLCWRPDGKAVTYVSGARSLTTLSLDGERTLWKDSDLPGPRHLRLGNYSSDGGWLLVSSDSADPDGRGNRDVWVLPHLGGAAKRLTQGPGTHVYPTWGPDQENVYFVSGKASEEIGTWGIWRVGVDRKTMLPKSAPAEMFVRPGSKFLHPRFVSSGRKLTYAVEEAKTDIWVGEADTVEKGTIVLRGQNPVLSPDGQTIYFVGEQPDQQGVFLINRNGSAASLRKVTDLTPLAKGLTRGGLSLAPDGEMLALNADDGKRQGVFVVPTSGGQPKLLEELPPKNKALPVWSPDGNWLAYAVDQQLVRISRDGRVREPLAQLHLWEGWSTRWSPDGKHLAAFGYESQEDFKNDTNQFAWVVSVADKQVRKLTNERKYKEGLEWHPSGEYITYMIYGPERLSAQIRRAYLDGRPPDLMIQQTNHWDYVGVWAPNGRQFLFKSWGANCLVGGNDLHVYDTDTKEIRHEVRGGALPAWSRDGRTAAWAKEETLRYFEVIESFQ